MNVILTQPNYRLMGFNKCIRYVATTNSPKFQAIGTHNNRLLALKHDFSLKMTTKCHKKQQNHKLMGFYKCIRHATNISVQKNQNFRQLDTTIAHNNPHACPKRPQTPFLIENITSTCVKKYIIRFTNLS